MNYFLYNKLDKLPKYFLSSRCIILNYNSLLNSSKNRFIL